MREAFIRSLRLRNDGSDICRLPSEVLALILEYLKILWPPSRREESETITAYQSGWLTATHVCSRIRDVRGFTYDQRRILTNIERSHSSRPVFGPHMKTSWTSRLTWCLLYSFALVNCPWILDSNGGTKWNLNIFLGRPITPCDCGFLLRYRSA